MIYVFYISGFLCIFGQIISLLEYKEILTTSKFKNITILPYKVFSIGFTWIFILLCVIINHEIISCFLVGMLLLLKIKSKSNFLLKHTALLLGLLGILLTFEYL